MHKTRADGGGVKTPLGKNIGYRKRMRDVWFAGFAKLPQMRIVSVHKCLTNAFYVCFRKKLNATGEQFGRGDDFGDFLDRRKEREVSFLTDDVIGTSIQISSIVVVFIGLADMRMLRSNDAGQSRCRGCLRGGKQHRTFSEK